MAMPMLSPGGSGVERGRGRGSCPCYHRAPVKIGRVEVEQTEEGGWEGPFPCYHCAPVKIVRVGVEESGGGGEWPCPCYRWVGVE